MPLSTVCWGLTHFVFLLCDHVVKDGASFVYFSKANTWLQTRINANAERLQEKKVIFSALDDTELLPI